MKTPLFWLGLLAPVSVYAIDAKISQAQLLTVELHDSVQGSDVRTIRVRDVESQKMAQLSLNRQLGDAKVWSGFFVIQFFKGDTSSRTLEFVGVNNTPYFAYVADSRAQKVLLFESTDQMAKYLAKNVQKAQEVIAPPQKAVAEVISPAKVAEIEQKVREQSRVQEVVQISLEEKLAKEKAELLERQAQLSAQEKQNKKNKAAELITEADSFYKEQNYEKASDLYAEATALDPENETYRYRHGVSLYKTGDYNQSLAALAVAEITEENILERDYYVALNHLKLKDYDKAEKKFNEIKDENDPVLSPTAAFFAGNIEYQKQKYPEARKNMEYVLDNSKDPQLDRSAEEMLEQIDRMENFIASKTEKYRFSFFAGPVYDQNVLNVATNNVATDVQAFRLNYGASALAVWHRTVNSDLGTQIALSDYYSMTTKFQPDATLQTADPMDVTFTVPYHREISLSDRVMNWELLPTYRSIYMSPTGGARNEVIRSMGASTTLASALTRDWYLSTKLDFFIDQSFLVVNSDDDKQSGNKYSLTISPTKMLNLKGDQTLTTDISYLINNSDGKNYRYQRMGLGLAYGFPAFWSSNGMVRADYATQAYNEATQGRTDTTMSLTGSLNKELAKRWNLATTLQYSIADSEVATYKYDKLMVMSVITYTMSILDQNK